jgi:para-aminobenzoate synthetase component I
MDKSTAIELMNRLGNQKKPFLFLVNFAMNDTQILQLSETGRDVFYDVDGITNCNIPATEMQKKLIFQKFPMHYEKYLEKFNLIHEEIKIGNTYLLNLTCPTEIKTNYSLFEIFIQSQAKFKLLYKDQFVVFSPEIFIQIKNNTIFSYPMKGTINASIRNAEKKIIADKKELAEHNTIVDLIRNDLSMVAKNVGVRRFRYIDRIKTNTGDLLQVSSEISGDLELDYNCRIGDILFRLLPAGSITGAPKQKTVEIINRVENYERGFYTGVFGLFDGMNLNSCVMIRFIEKTKDCLCYKSGGGITSFSDALSEYNEMVEKVYVPIF